MSSARMSSRDAFNPFHHADAPALIFTPPSDPSASPVCGALASDDDVLSHSGFGCLRSLGRLCRPGCARRRGSLSGFVRLRLPSQPSTRSPR
jgi:hypothetical protein